MNRYVTISLLVALSSAPAMAQDWTTLVDDRFGYTLPVPSSYTLTFRPEAGNARIFHNDRRDLLAVWAGRLDDASFADMVETRRREDEAQGWTISYERVMGDWASYSGTKNDEIRYVRAIRYCGDRTAFFLIDYAIEDKERYDPIVTRMVRQLRPKGTC